MQIRNQIVTGFDLFPDGACRACYATPPIRESRLCNRSGEPCCSGRWEESNGAECAENRHLGERHARQGGQLHGSPERLPATRGVWPALFQLADLRPLRISVTAVTLSRNLAHIRRLSNCTPLVDEFPRYVFPYARENAQDQSTS